MLKVLHDSKSGARDTELGPCGSERAQTNATIERDAEAREFAREHPRIKWQVVRDESRAVNPPCNRGGNPAEYGRSLYHRSRNPMQANRSNISFRVDKRFVFVDRLQCPGVECN